LIDNKGLLGYYFTYKTAYIIPQKMSIEPTLLFETIRNLDHPTIKTIISRTTRGYTVKSLDMYINFKIGKVFQV
jgi:hypothetical protein